MKKLTLPRLKSLAPQPKKKVRKLAANAAHRLTPPAFEDYDEEPTTKLSTAFVVVLVLHLVAVGGIYAFHSIKAHRHESEPVPASEAAKPVASTPSVAPSVVGAAVGAAVVAKTVSNSSPASASKVPVANTAPPSPAAPTQPQSAAKAIPTKVEPSGPSAVIPQAKPVPPTVTQPTAVAGAHADIQAGTKTYTVAKGDNPVAIAKRLGVNYDELLKLNGIEDPKKLQIGQVLKVPAKKAAN